MKVVDIVNAQNTLQKVATASGLPIPISYKMIPVMKAAADVAELFNKKRDELVKEMGEPQKLKKGEKLPPGQGHPYVIPPEKMKEFEEAIKQELDGEVSLPDIKLSMEELDKHVDLSMVEVGQIEWLLEP